MAETFVGAATAASSSVTLPSHQTGDLIIIVAARASSSQSAAAGYTSLSTANSGSNVAYNVGYKYAASSGESSGTWTGATAIAAMVFRGFHPTAAVSATYLDTDSATGSTKISYPSITSIDTNESTSWQLLVGAVASTTSTVENPPGSHTLRANRVGTGIEIAAFTRSIVSTAGTAALGLSTDWLSVTLEIRGVLEAAASITEDADTLSATATLTAGSGITADASITEGNDTVSATGGLRIAAAAAITEGADTLSSTSQLLISGQASITEDADTASATMAILRLGAADIIEGDDTLSATGTLPIVGALAVNEDGDSLLATGRDPTFFVNVYNGSSFVPYPMKMYRDEGWETIDVALVKRWNGSVWVQYAN